MRPLVILLSAVVSLGLWLLLEGQAASKEPAQAPQGEEPIARMEAPTAREALLERRVRMLEAQLEPAPMDAAPTSLPKPDGGTREPAGCLDVLATHFSREVTRDAWTETRASVLREWVDGSEARDVVDRIECRGRTCRLDVSDMSAAGRSLMMPLLQRMPRQLKAVHVANCTGAKAVIYIQY